MTERLDPKDRTQQLLSVALHLAAREGWANLTHSAVAKTAGVSNGLVVSRLGTMAALRRSVMRAAVAQGVVPVVAEGLAAGDKHARKADEALRAACGERVRTA